MAKEFNYHAAWRELVEPAWKNAHPLLHATYDWLAVHGGEHNQQTNLRIPIPDPITQILSQIPPEDMAMGAEACYWWGHLGHTDYVLLEYPGLPSEKFYTTWWDVFSGSVAARACAEDLSTYDSGKADWKLSYVKNGPQDGVGASWKLKLMVEDYLIENEASRWADLGIRMKRLFDFEPYKMHKPGTKYDCDELPDLIRDTLAGACEIVRALYVNHKPHVFVFDSHSFPKETWDQPTCGHRSYNGPRCGLPPAEHTSEHAVLVKLTRNVPKSEFIELVKLCEKTVLAHGARLDGIALAESPWKITE